MNRKLFLSALLVVLVGGGIFYWSQSASAGDASPADPPVDSLVKVQVGTLRRATLHGYVTGFGLIQPAPAATARVAAPVAGVVKRVLVHEGQRVAAGATLIELEDRAAVVAVNAARELNDRQRRLYAEHNASQKSLQESASQLAAAQARLDLLHIAAPLAGTVARLNVRPGEGVDLNTVVAEISDFDHLTIAVAIPAADAGRIALGDALAISGDPAVTAPVTFIGPAVDPSNDTVTVRADLPAGHGFRSGSVVPVRITAEQHADCLAAPEASVVIRPDGQAVVARVRGDEAVQIPVKVGLREDGLTEVAGAGLAAGDTVVTIGAYGLPEHTRIEIAAPAASDHAAQP